MGAPVVNQASSAWSRFVDVALDADAIARLEGGFPPGAAAGFRYPEAQLKTLGI